MEVHTRFISLRSAVDRTGRSRWWLRSQWLAGSFPQPVSVGYRGTMFVESEVEAWLQARIAERDSRAA